MRRRVYSLGSVVVVFALAFANLTLVIQLQHRQVALLRMNAATQMLETNCAALIKKGNEIGFKAALYGYAASQSGEDPAHFYLMSTEIFGGTNLPDIQLHWYTNAADIEALKEKRRL